VVQTSADPRTEASGPAAEARRREILAAASRLFRVRGLHATGMREIAAELGMTAGNLYYYFPSKQELLAYCQEATLAELLALAAEVEADDPPPDEALSRLLSGHVQVLNEKTPGSLAHLEVNEVPPERRPRLLALRRRYEAVYRRLIERGVATGVLRPVDPRLATLALLGAVNWTVKWFDADGPSGAAEVGSRFADLLLHGLARAGEGAAAP
jgi:TetR/AcrR family transcriptional regulator, cholesterol catabolism regulator